MTNTYDICATVRLEVRIPNLDCDENPRTSQKLLEKIRDELTLVFAEEHGYAGTDKEIINMDQIEIHDWDLK